MVSKELVPVYVSVFTTGWYVSVSEDVSLLIIRWPVFVNPYCQLRYLSSNRVFSFFEQELLLNPCYFVSFQACRCVRECPSPWFNPNSGC